VSPFDQAVIDMGKTGELPETMLRMMAQTMGRLIVSRYRTRPARVEAARSVMVDLRNEMEARS
jgi:hypothetical protein